MCLTKKEYEKTFQFFDQIRVSAPFFRKKVQTLLADLFGYSQTIFWLADEQGNIYNPEMLNVPDQVIYDYEDHFFKYDLLHPQKQFSLFPEHPVLRLDDVVSLPDYERTYYYSEFMRKYHYHHRMGVYFIDQGRLYGAMGMTRSKDQPAFTAGDAKRLSLLSPHIGHLLASHIRLEESTFQNKLLQAHEQVSAIGLIMVDSNLRVRFANKTARDICGETADSVEIFLHRITHQKPNWRSGFTQQVFSGENTRWKVQLIPEPEGILNRCEFSIYLFPDESVARKEIVDFNLSEREMEIFNLIEKGWPNSKIANQLCISVNTVKKHLHNIYQKLDVNNRTSLVHKMTSMLPC